MTSLFSDALHERLGAWPLGYIPYGGADYGEVLSIARTVKDGDDNAFHAAWMEGADTMMDEAHVAHAQGHWQSARDLFLRAAVFYGKSFHTLFGEPVD